MILSAADLPAMPLIITSPYVYLLSAQQSAKREIGVQVIKNVQRYWKVVLTSSAKMASGSGLQRTG
ncbi:hypothetical protein F2Q70_00029718 [Brassica cretica]|uniref:Uncharacterized protein n=1 Tax=Brassica cretica TaxID=69181 RepID=A0A3N6QLI7_BRACR|nr:hypothetical protein F2Q70_00029718 [Brassica cretica]KAF2598572.1 hypothetical protein F2Q68_00010822 [Brassica cretica]